MDNDHWLNRVLAEVETKRSGIGQRPSLYGACDIAAKYCGLDSPPTPIPGHWQHGWKAPHRQFTAQYQMGEIEPLSPDEHFWVARKDQEQCLRDAGLNHSRAIGLPCVYLPELSVTRYQDSLLVMPAHSLDYTRHDWKFDEYADQIAAIRNDFEEVIACVHKSCYDRGIWVDSFRDRNIPVVVGAHTSDPLTLYRQQALLSSFGYVTTNSHGSHLAYGAYWGARVSIFGTYAEMQVEDYSNTPFYQRFPELIEPAVDAVNEQGMRKHYSHLFVEHPRKAMELSEWGATELGAENRLGPSELRDAFHWSWRDFLSNRFTRLTKRIGKAFLPRSMRRKWERNPKSNESILLAKEIAQINSSTADQVSTSSLLGHVIHFRDGPSCAAEARLLFEQNVLQFHTARPNPRIIDLGANIGLASIYFARLHPDATVFCFEPDQESFALLEKNCDSFKLQNVEKTCSGVEKVDLETLFTEPVDLLHLALDSRKLLKLLVHDSGLKMVDRICIRYHGNFSDDQRLPEIFQILEDSGFRVHIHSSLPAAQPFIHRPVVEGCDLHLVVFGIREGKSTVH